MPSPLSHQELSDLIGRIYDCTLDPGLWEPTIDAVKDVLECHLAQLGLIGGHPARSIIAVNRGPTQELIEVQNKYVAYVTSAIEEVLDGGLSIDEPLIVMRDMPPDFKKSPYIKESFAVSGSADIAQLHIVRSPTRLSYLGLGRPGSAGVFDDSSVEIMRLLIPHVRRAVTISDVLDAKTIKETRLAETLDALKLGVVLADEDAKVIHANRAAEAMLRSDGPLSAVNGVMGAQRPAASAELKQAIAGAARDEAAIGKAGLAVRLSDDYETPVVAHVLPLANGEVRTRLDPEAVAAVFINSPLDEASCAKAIADAYRLTPAEIRVLGPILSGKTVAEAGAEVGVAATTARTHLDNIFAKTGVSRQSELIKLAAQIAPVTK